MYHATVASFDIFTTLTVYEKRWKIKEMRRKNENHLKIMVRQNNKKKEKDERHTGMWKLTDLTLKRLGGGGPKKIPSTFRAITLQRAKLSPRHFMTFFFQVSRTFWHQICDARGYGSEVK